MTAFAKGDKVRAKGETWNVEKVFQSGVVLCSRQSDHERRSLLANARDLRKVEK